MFLTEKPEWLGGLDIAYNRGTGFSLFGEAVYTGTAYGLSEDNAFVSLDASLVVNSKLSYRVFLGTVFGEVYVRVDNLFDRETLPQLGLPGPGRFVSTGLNVSF